MVLLCCVHPYHFFVPSPNIVLVTQTSPHPQKCYLCQICLCPSTDPNVPKFICTNQDLISEFELFCSLQVERAKKCLDFASTCYIFHLIFCCIYEGFPTSFGWCVLYLCLCQCFCLCPYFCPCFLKTWHQGTPPSDLLHACFACW